jgi:hypothetical protein
LFTCNAAHRLCKSKKAERHVNIDYLQRHSPTLRSPLNTCARKKVEQHARNAAHRQIANLKRMPKEESERRA